ncbi:MAG: hypothetical protein U0586_07280 [Candidatus Brocadiaceae bacterium]
MIREIQNPDIFEMLGLRLIKRQRIDASSFSWKNIESVGSGKAALSLILGYLRQKGNFSNKTFNLCRA